MAHMPMDGGGGAPAPAVETENKTSAHEEAWRNSAKASLKLLGAGVLTFVLTVGTISVFKISDHHAAVGVGLATALAALAAIRGIETLVHRMRIARREWSKLAVAVDVSILIGAAFTFFGLILTYILVVGFQRGRQLRSRGKVLLPPVADGKGWTTLSTEARAPEALRAKLATQWRENGRTEHASVAAFARLTLNLIALGAPAKLIESANRDSLDEIRHAELCFSIARSLDGRTESPGPFPKAQHAGALSSFRTIALAQLAVSSLVDGALHEGISARVLARLVKRCEEPVIREALRELAADEGRHAAHGWDVVEWCLEEGGAAIAHALLGALKSLPTAIDYSLAPEARDSSWEKVGVPGEALEKQEHAKAREELVRHVRRLTGRAAEQTAAV